MLIIQQLVKSWKNHNSRPDPFFTACWW